jgi:hypothetical protein
MWYTQLTCFTGTKVQILTLRARLQGLEMNHSDTRSEMFEQVRGLKLPVYAALSYQCMRP